MESDKKSGVAGLPMEAFSYDVQSNRRRFSIELKPDETTIVSWTKLLRDSGIQVDHSPPPSPESSKQINQEDESRDESSNVVLKKERNRQNHGSPTTEHCQPKKQRIDASEVLEETNVVQVTKNTKKGHARVKSTTDQNYYGKKQTLLSASVTSCIKDPSVTSIKFGSRFEMTSDRASICTESQSMSLTSHASEEQSLKNEINEVPDLNVPCTVQAASILPTHIKDEYVGMANVSMLESTFLELETMVAVSRQLHGDVHDADHLVATKSRVPRDIKKKLETIGRLALLCQGRISEELIMRLMSILGHRLKLRTLKRCLKEMISDDLSVCGGGVRFSQIQKEVVEMIKLRTLSLEAKDGASNGIIELPAAHKARYTMDHEMEDKICDFYDIYVQGMNEVKSSEIRKFYVQLAGLWPKGTMDNHGIRNAICRAKERRRMLLQEKGHEKDMQKKTSTARMDETLHGEANLVAHRERPVNDTNAPVSTFSDSVIPGTPELDQNLSARAKRSSPPSVGSCQDLHKASSIKHTKDLAKPLETENNGGD